MMVLVTGGAASGKSEYAERLVCGEVPEAADVPMAEGPRIYVAAMQPFGSEAEERIRKHRAAREHRGFLTVERYTDLSGLSVPPGSRVLLEDLGNLTANEMFSAGGTAAPGETADAVIRGLLRLKEHCGLLVAVTNEIFSGGCEYPAETTRYMRALGEVNRRAAAAADRVTEVVCGIPVQRRPDPAAAIIESSGTGPERRKREEEKMILITGPLCSGKKRMAERILKEYRAAEPSVEYTYAGEVQALAEKAGSPAELEALADRLAGFCVVTASETGCGVIPAERAEREKREKAGRLCCMLAERASAVVHMCCGIPSVLKGNLVLPAGPQVPQAGLEE